MTHSATEFGSAKADPSLRAGETQSALVRLPPLVTGSNRPIVLKKSAMVSTAEKYALEIEIFTLNRGFWAQISRSGAQKRLFQQAVGKDRLFQHNPTQSGPSQRAAIDIQGYDHIESIWHQIIA